jgi:hypothetical protein
MRLLHNTILGNLTYDGEYCTPLYHHFRSNIVMGTADITSGECMVFTHNDVVLWLNIAPGDSVFANIHEDPFFCASTSGDFTLAEDSPCVGTAHDGGEIGAFGVGCGVHTMVIQDDLTWGRIKNLFRR